ncbi:MAG: GNAT family N-acetyltransferase [Ignavibacteria bacterium]|nr:GNAT family N-acetyltransferase [Ignavibacteria bacterium]
MVSEIEQLDLKNSFSTSTFITEANNSKLLSLRNKSEWLAYLNRLPESLRDVYYTPEYYEIYEKNGSGKAFCFVFEDGNHLAFYPFLLNRINDFGYKLEDSYYDIQGAYGYNGVIYSSDNPDFRKNFYCHFEKFCKDNNIVAEFTRFNPLLGNQTFSEDFLNVIYDRQTVYVDLTQKYDDIYKNYTRSARHNLNKSLANNLNVIIYKNKFPYKKEFIEMYNETMDKVHAENFLYFSDDYFENTFNLPSSVQFVVFKDNNPIASSLSLGAENYLHVHFKASKSDYLSFRPNNLLFDEIIKYGIEKGFKGIHVGGGRTSSADDSLLRFKKNFSKTTRGFYIGKKIYNESIYKQVCEQWKANHTQLVDKYKDRILAYRYFD